MTSPIGSNLPGVNTQGFKAAGIGQDFQKSELGKVFTQGNSSIIYQDPIRGAIEINCVAA
jgi:hypothetical protein